MQDASAKPAALKFTGYQKFVVGILAFLQFSIILDFMVIAPLGAIVMPALQITPQQFALVVSAYAFSAGVSAMLAAGFADRFDRKKLLLFFYTGFILGTALCAVAATFHLLLAARIVTGIFGGVIGSIVMAITTDLFALEIRGRVMGIVQTAFAASQILGLPIALYLANAWNWHAPFVLIIVVGSAVGVVIMMGLKPVDMHLGLKQEHSPLMHLVHTITDPRYLLAFATVTLLATGGFMIMPFSSAFTVNNLGISLDHLPTVYLATGLCTIFVGPLIGRASDRFGKFRVFAFGTAVSVIMALIYTHLGETPLPVVIAVNAVMFVGIFSRIIPATALMSAIPDVTKRGAFNAVSSSLQQVSGGIASVIAGFIVVQNADGHISHFDRVGYVVIGAALITVTLMYRIHRSIVERTAKPAV